MTNYQELLIRIKGSTLNDISLGREKVKLRLSLKDRSEGLVLNLLETFYLPNSSYNLVSLARLNNSGIFHNNEDENLYHIKTHQILAQAPWWNNSYLLQLLNFFDSAIQLTHIANNIYEWPQGLLRNSSLNKLLSLTTWHKWLGQFNIFSVK